MGLLVMYQLIVISTCFSLMPSLLAGTESSIEVKVVATRALSTDVELYRSQASSPSSGNSASMPVAWAPDTGDMLMPCQGGASVLRVVAVQPPTKKAISARDFRNGLRGGEVLVGCS
jgi:methionyl-tRNA formyltransferase